VLSVIGNTAEVSWPGVRDSNQWFAAAIAYVLAASSPPRVVAADWSDVSGDVDGWQR
jgi:hypothetical protein